VGGMICTALNNQSTQCQALSTTALLRLPGAMVARLASIADGTKRLQVRVLRWSFCPLLQILRYGGYHPLGYFFFFSTFSIARSVYRFHAFLIVFSWPALARDTVSRRVIVPRKVLFPIFLISSSLTRHTNAMEPYREISQHSSNPLELPSSDARNRAAVLRYRKARAMAGNQRDSDEPEDDLEVSDLKDYQNHVAGLLQVRPAPQAQYATRGNVGAEALIDLDEDMDGENSNESEMDSDLEVGADADADGEVDEEMSLFLKPREEQEEIELEMADLEEAVPSIAQDYKLIDRLGTGTFSSVYKAIDLGYHEKWDNAVWHGSHPRASTAHYQSVPRAPGTKVFVAIKRIYVTSNPERIRNEISILETCRGSRHVSQLITAFRHEDQVVAVLPYHPHEDFRVRTTGLSKHVLPFRVDSTSTVVLPHPTDRWNQSVLQMHVSCIAGHSCAWHHPP
jgi:hypothetical protein